jgi:hypothetical protein
MSREQLPFLQRLETSFSLKHPGMETNKHQNLGPRITNGRQDEWIVLGVSSNLVSLEGVGGVGVRAATLDAGKTIVVAAHASQYCGAAVDSMPF